MFLHHFAIYFFGHLFIWKFNLILLTKIEITNTFFSYIVLLLNIFPWLSLKTEMWIDTYFEILLLFGKYSFFKIILPAFLCFCMANRNFTYYCRYSDKKLKCSFSSCIGMELCSTTNMTIEAFDKTMQAKWVSCCHAITNTSCVYLLTCVWMCCYLKVQKFNISLILALNYTKATRSRLGLVSFPF